MSDLEESESAEDMKCAALIGVAFWFEEDVTDVEDWTFVFRVSATVFAIPCALRFPA